MIKISFHGAAQDTSGQCFLISTTKNKFLIDCGLFISNSTKEEDVFNTRLRNKHFPFEPSKLDFVLLTHSHIDHSGNLPNLVKKGFRGKIYLTKWSAIQLENQYKKLICRNGFDLFSFDDVEKTKGLFSVVHYKDTNYISDRIEFTYYNSNHILGSASIKLLIEGKKIWISGDIGKEPTYPFDVDYLIMESTFGDKITSPGNHATQEILTKYAISERIKPKMTFLVHSSFNSGLVLKTKLDKERRAYFPLLNTQIEL